MRARSAVSEKILWSFRFAFRMQVVKEDNLGVQIRRPWKMRCGQTGI